jgi:FKBP-type peptidyl-prolyl cis-trans isomerase 2
MSGKKALIMAVLLVAVVALMAGCAGQSKTAKTGDNVTVDYIEMYENGTILDTSNATLAQQAGIYDDYNSYEPIQFIIGEGSVIPGFENAIIGMKAGETKNITISPADGYGAYDPTYIEPVNMSDLIEANITPYVNQTLNTLYGQVRVDHIEANETDYNSSLVYIDFNHPLAGKTLHFQITLRTVETPAATPTAAPTPGT